MSDAASSRMSNRAWIMVVAGAVVVTLSMGVRQTFGLFLTPLGLEMSISREAFGLAIAIQNLLFGLAQPFVGAWADRHGAGRVAAVGAAAYLAGLVLTSTAAGLFGITLGLGVLVGLAMAGCTFTVVLGAVGKAVPEGQRTLAFGIVTAGGSLGQFLLVPATQGLVDALGWRDTLLILGGLIALILPLAMGVAGKPATSATDDGPDLKAALSEAAAHPSFWMLNMGFFVCGFHIAFVGTHLPAYLRDQGLTPGVGAMALALIGLFNILGSAAWGAWGSKHSKKRLLVMVYALRGVAITLFLLFPISAASALVFAASFGFLWLGTVPLTNGLIALIYGVRNLSALGGIVFLSHQVGAFLGAWLGGMAFSVLGSYDAIWMATIALALLAALANAPIREVSLRTPQVPA